MNADAELTARQEKAIAALLAAKSTRQAAKQAGCSETALRSWMSQAPFAARLRAARALVMEEVITRLIGLASSAVSCLERNISNKATPQVQVRAAAALLEHMMKVAALADLQAQIEELRQQLVLSKIDSPAAAGSASPAGTDTASSPAPAVEDAPGLDPLSTQNGD